MGKFRLNVADVVIILLAAALVGFSSFAAYIQPQNSIRVVIQSSGSEWIFPMDAEETVTVRGPLGDTIVRIHGNEAWVEASPCQNQTCVAMGHINSRGAWVACLPNNVFFLIEGSDESGNEPDVHSW